MPCLLAKLRRLIKPLTPHVQYPTPLTLPGDAVIPSGCNNTLLLTYQHDTHPKMLTTPRLSSKNCVKQKYFLISVGHSLHF